MHLRDSRYHGSDIVGCLLSEPPILDFDKSIIQLMSLKQRPTNSDVRLDGLSSDSPLVEKSFHAGSCTSSTIFLPVIASVTVCIVDRALNDNCVEAIPRSSPFHFEPNDVLLDQFIVMGRRHYDEVRR